MSTHLTSQKTKAQSFILQLDWCNTAARAPTESSETFRNLAKITSVISLVEFLNFPVFPFHRPKPRMWSKMTNTHSTPIDFKWKKKHSRISGLLIFSTRVCKTDKHTFRNPAEKHQAVNNSRARKTCFFAVSKPLRRSANWQLCSISPHVPNLIFSLFPLQLNSQLKSRFF